MSMLQRLIKAMLPPRLAQDVQAQSQQWQVRCLSCGNSRSLWDSGGIRWKAASHGKRTLVRCSTCRRIRCAAIERTPPSIEAET